MGWFEKFTLFCMVLVITSLSCILIASVQLLHRTDDRINRGSVALLERLRVLRSREDRRNYIAPSEPLLAVVIRSSKANYALRRAIRRTWAREDHRVVHRFVLVASNQLLPNHVPFDNEATSVSGWLARLHRRGNVKSARYFLFVDDTVFVNTRTVLEALERTLPTKQFVLCTPKTDPNNRTLCDVSHPVLISGDIVQSSWSKDLPVAHDGQRLQLSRRDTEVIFHQLIAGIVRLVFFFSAPLDQLSSISIPPPLLIERLWGAVNGNFSTVDA